MKKIEAFKRLYELERVHKIYKEQFGEDHSYTKNALIEWYGGKEIIEAAGLFEEYFDYKMKRIQESN